jgi:trans-aconitate 2-methyltransferase
MDDWDADLYRQFERERTRPAQDLLNAVDLAAPARIVDLGCGPGNSTELLARRFPRAGILGLDTSAAMLADARARLPDCRFEQADIAVWRPEAPPDLIFANAALQWVGDHPQLYPRLLSYLAPGGVLAVQVPDNREEPSHRLMREVAAEPRFAGPIGNAAATRVRILPGATYYDMLAPHAAEVDMWRTTYHHPTPSAGAIVAWLRATGLKPFVEPLGSEDRAAFLARYEARIAEAYPPRADGRLLLAFPRLFVVARRGA